MTATAPNLQGNPRSEPPSYREELHQIREGYNTAYVFIDQAICFEKANRKEDALSMYCKSIEPLNEGLSIRLELLDCSESERTEANQLQRKLRVLRDDVHGRIYALSDENNPPEVAPPYQSSENSLYPDLDAEFPPSYGEALNSASGVTHSTLSAASCPPYEAQHSSRVLLHIPFGVQVFHVSTNNRVSVQSDPTELYIYTLSKAYQLVTPQTVSWIQVGEFTYPLVPGKSPILKTGYGAYIFPEVRGADESSNVALVLSAEISDETRNRLDELFKDYAKFLQQQQVLIDPENVTIGQKISDGIVSVSESVSRAMVRGAEATSTAINYGTEKLKERMTPDQKAYIVDPRVQTGLKVARATTDVTRKVTGFVVSAVGDMTMALGRRIATAINSPDVADGISRNGTLNEALLVAGGSIAGFGTLFKGLEDAGKILANGIATNTVTLVDYRYGQNAGEVVGDALHSVGNFALTANNVQNLGIRGIAKRTAKNTGKAVLEQYTLQPATYTVQDPDGMTAGPSSKRQS